MDFSEKELKLLLEALYKYRGVVAGATQAARNKMEEVQSVIGKIEAKIGPLKPEKTSFDKEMEKSLSALKTQKADSKKKK